MLYTASVEGKRWLLNPSTNTELDIICVILNVLLTTFSSCETCTASHCFAATSSNICNNSESPLSMVATEPFLLHLP